MKRIEAVISRAALNDFYQCAKRLGIFGFDLSEEQSRLSGRQPQAANIEARPKLKVDFAVLDDQIKPTVHAVLEAVHPESIAIFKFDRDAGLPATT